MKKLLIILAAGMCLMGTSCQKKEAKSLPVVHTSKVKSFTSTSAELEGVITNHGGGEILERGFLLGDTRELSFETSEILIDPRPGYGAYMVRKENIPVQKVYYVRAWARNDKGIALADEIQSFLNSKAMTYPTVTNTTDPDPDSDVAALLCHIDHNGNAPLLEAGIYYGKTEDFEPGAAGVTRRVAFTAPEEEEKPEDYAEPDELEIELTDLEENTTYYFKSFAVNRIGEALSEAYGSFTTATAAIPTPANGETTEINEDVATIRGTISDRGKARITERGFYYSTTENFEPEQATRIVVDSEEMTFTHKLTELEPNTTYYYKTFAVNAKGEGVSDRYGSFKTLVRLSTPTLTPTVSEKTSISAEISTEATTGDGTLLKAGILYSTSTFTADTLDVNLNKIRFEETITSPFVINIPDLEPNTTYYYATYASNEKYLGYSAIGTFTTESIPYLAVESIKTATRIRVQSTFRTTGASAVTSYGLRYKNGANIREFTDPVETDDTFTVDIENLIPSTSYELESYAVNPAGEFVHELIVSTDAMIPERRGNKLRDGSESDLTYDILLPLDGSLSYEKHGKWLDRNLGASRFATADPALSEKDTKPSSSTVDLQAAGWEFQWGRKADGHQDVDWTRFGISDTDLGNAAQGWQKYGWTMTGSSNPTFPSSNSTTPEIITANDGAQIFIRKGVSANAAALDCQYDDSGDAVSRTPENNIFYCTGKTDWAKSGVGTSPDVWKGTAGAFNPCPEGWEVPVANDFAKLTADFPGIGTNNQANFIPAHKFLAEKWGLVILQMRTSHTGNLQPLEAAINRYWTANGDANFSAQCWMVNGTNRNITTGVQQRSNAGYIRCIQK